MAPNSASVTRTVAMTTAAERRAALGGGGAAISVVWPACWTGQSTLQKPTSTWSSITGGVATPISIASAPSSTTTRSGDVMGRECAQRCRAPSSLA